MNEDLIRKFANEASEFAENSEFNTSKELTPELLKVRDLKLAELIVKECASQLNRRGVEGFGILEERNLLEHFGVEE